MSFAGQCIVILGPTCSWKSQVALELAPRYNAEIISCDSMQIYRGLDIGTAKPSSNELAQVPHHLIDELEMEQRYDANRFCLMAKDRLENIYRRGKAAILVGGTGLYAKALVYGFAMLPADQKLAAALQEKLQQPGGRELLLRHLQEKLGSELPAAVYENPRRLLRACEVFELCGRTPWEIQSTTQQPKPGFLQFCILPKLSLLKERIQERCAAMLAAGWVQEALQAEARGLLKTPTAKQALGYKDIIEFQRNGAPGGDAALFDILSRRTVRYARRQLTWFKKQHPGAFSIMVDTADNAPAKLCASIENYLYQLKIKLT
ncbi:MAG: tRNA (adenosine(37)-N6)-dimethylallyltransferase MiaA [Oligosphaeraceae bacterium]|nr:tRNA (adenosine(37)-N6)-dimethylallyltransferase MiaA [Oligosphaeraceae bacterium]